MANANLMNYSFDGLKELQLEIEKELKHRQQQEVKKAREQILSIAEDLGVPVEQLFANMGAKQKSGSRKKVQPQYQNPADNSQTWSGRGRQPKWIVDWLSSGRSLNELKI